MNRTFKFLQAHWSVIVTAVLACAAMLLGADGFAMAEVVEVPDNPPAASADHKGLETQLDKGASGTEARQAGLEAEDIDKAIAKFRTFHFPLYFDIVMNAQQSKADSYEKIHYRSGTNPLECSVTADVTATGTGIDEQLIVLTSGTDISAEDLTVLKEYSTVFAPSVQGYNKDGAESGDLALYVMKSNEEKATLRVLNPKAGTSTVLPGGTKLIVGATAGSESQMIVPPDNYMPVPTVEYLQKKIANIVYTDDWLKQIKKVPFFMDDLEENALYNFKRRNARSHWDGFGKKILVTVDANMGKEYVYFENGILRQIPMYFTIGDAITPNDLNAISKMQFTDNSANDSARAYCGKNMVEKLLNMETTTYRPFKFEEVQSEGGFKIRKWTSNFGDLDIVYDPTLNDIGYQDCMVVVDIKNAVRYVKREEKTDTQDMKKGTGQVREAQRKITSIIDCIALKGYNAILVGPASMVTKANTLGGINTWGQSAAELPATGLTDGMLVYLTAADGGFDAGALVQYDAASQSWHEYTGEIKANA